MNDAFLLHLRGPLQSFADRGFGQIREAGPFPSRSAVLGLVAAAQGLPRNDPRLVGLHDSLRIHVATARPGEVRMDFHTVDAGGKNKTLTYRDYHHDAHFVALVEARTPSDAEAVDEARAALDAPYYVTYLGRKACPPSIPLLPVAHDGENVVTALIHAAVEAAPIRRREPLRLYLDGRWTADEVEAMHSTARLAGYGERRDRLVQPRRAYAGRPYTELLVPLPEEPAPDPQLAYFDAAS